MHSEFSVSDSTFPAPHHLPPHYGKSISYLALQKLRAKIEKLLTFTQEGGLTNLR